MARIVFLQPHLRFGGAERQTVIVSNRLVETGHECHIILHSAEGGLLSELDPRVQVHDLGAVSHAAIPLIAPRLARVLRQLDPSYIVVKLWSSILSASLVDRRFPEHTFNYCEDLDPTDHAEYISFGRLKQRLIRRVFRSRATLSANTHTVADSMVSVYGLKTRPDIIPSTVDVALVRSKAAEIPVLDLARDRAHVVSVGSLIERKGLRITLAALEQVDRDVDWHIVGVGPLDEELRSYRDPRGRLHLILHGGLATPYGVMRDADLLVHSAASEAFGIVLLESMAVGTPVVAADAIGASEIVATLGSNEELITLCPSNSAASLAQAIDAKLSNAKPANLDAQEYLTGYSLTNSTAIWISRATEAGH